LWSEINFWPIGRLLRPAAAAARRTHLIHGQESIRGRLEEVVHGGGGAGHGGAVGGGAAPLVLSVEEGRGERGERGERDRGVCGCGGMRGAATAEGGWIPAAAATRAVRRRFLFGWERERQRAASRRWGEDEGGEMRWEDKRI
jgi:hypothetical protein